MHVDDPHRALIERYLAAYDAFDVAGMVALLHPDVTFENVAGGEVTASARGHDEFRALAERGATLFASRRQAMRAYHRTPDGARVEVDVEAVLAADIGPGLQAGDTLQVAGVSTFEIRDGRIVRLVDAS